MRRIVAFACEGDTLLGTLDAAAGRTGVLIVSGGNEIRCGAHRGMASLAQRLAAAGVPAFRFDRRGVGDSTGENRGNAASAPDIAAAAAAFRRDQPHVVRLLGFGNCDAATALALLDRDCEALVLANPWLGDEDAAPPPEYYWRRLRDPAAWRGNPLAKLKGFVGALIDRTEQPLAARMAAALAARPTTIVLANRDRTAQVFAATIGVDALRLDTASHSFAGAEHAIERIVRDAVARLDDK